MIRLAPIDAHRRWAQFYDAQPNAALALEQRVLRQLLAAFVFADGAADHLVALDIACGTGRWMRELEACGGQVWGIDACPEMIAQAGPLRERTAVADAGSLPFAGEAADLAICSFALDYISDLDAAVCEMARVIRPDGHLVVADLHPGPGWFRSFRAGRDVYEAAHFDRPIGTVVAAIARTGLKPIVRVEAGFGEAERPLFEAAGKEMPRDPAVWAGVWKKSCC